EFLADMRRYGRTATMDNYLMWARMRMDPTDLADVTGAGYTFLMNGLTSEGNWTGLFSPGERVRLRFINVGAMTFHDVRIPGLPMSVVHADGQDVQPVEIDEFRIGPAETYDVIVTPGDRAYTIFSETLDRSGYVRGTIAPRAGMTAEIPARRPRPLRTMGDMGMSMAMDKPMPGMVVGTDKNAKAGGAPMTMGTPADEHAGHQMPGMAMPPSKDGAVKHGPDSHGSGNQMIPMSTRPMWSDPGIGLGGEGRRVLVYADLKARETFDPRGPARELEIHLTGHMERFMWSLDGKKFSQAPEPIRFRLGERLRWTFVNDTMMDHTMHLHGMFMQLDNGAGEYLPRKHTVLVKPAERLSVLITPDELGPFAFHCHLDLHMAAGMFRVVLVTDDQTEAE
ncbi:MAG: copper resistance system multicopper oxidase, partial [Acidobacteriota bacterium]